MREGRWDKGRGVRGTGQAEQVEHRAGGWEGVVHQAWTPRTTVATCTRSGIRGSWAPALRVACRGAGGGGEGHVTQ